MHLGTPASPRATLPSPLGTEYPRRVADVASGPQGGERPGNRKALRKSRHSDAGTVVSRAMSGKLARRPHDRKYSSVCSSCRIGIPGERPEVRLPRVCGQHPVSRLPATEGPAHGHVGPRGRRERQAEGRVSRRDVMGRRPSRHEEYISQFYSTQQSISSEWNSTSYLSTVEQRLLKGVYRL